MKNKFEILDKVLADPVARNDYAISVWESFHHCRTDPSPERIKNCIIDLIMTDIEGGKYGEFRRITLPKNS